MKRIALLAVLFTFTSSFNMGFAAEPPGWAGIWEGVIHISEIDIDMEISLVLEEKAGLVSGRISDDWGFIRGDIVEPVLNNGVLTFKTWVETAPNDHEMSFRMTVSGDTMDGRWESLGSFGDWRLVRLDKAGRETRKGLQTADLIGVWVGPAAYKSRPSSKNICTLVLKERDGKLEGSFSDQFGTPYEPVKIRELQDNHLMCDVAFSYRNESMVMRMDLGFKSATKMKARFAIEKMGETGLWAAEKRAAK